MTACTKQPGNAPAGRRAPETNSRTIGPNPIQPDRMTPKERLAEVCALLAAGLLRLRARQSSELSAPTGESSLPFSPDRSGHANTTHGERVDP